MLPFALVGTETSENHLALGLAEEITSALARFRWMFLVSSSSVAQFVQDGRDDVALRQTLGLDYLLDGTVQRVAERLRITLRLVDLQDGNQIVWSRRFDRMLDDLLVLQDEIAAEVVAQIDPEILVLESRRAKHRTSQGTSAYELTLRALPGMTRFERGPFLEAGALLRQAIARQPDFAPAHSWYAFWIAMLIDQGWSENRAQLIEEAAEHAEQAVALDPQEARGFALAGHVRAVLQRRFTEAFSLQERALALNPNLAAAWAVSGLTHVYAGDWAEAERRLQRYKQLSPTDPYSFQFEIGFSYASFLRRDYDAAARLGRSVGELSPSFRSAYKPLLAALGYLGQGQDALLARRRLLAVEPDFTVRKFVETSPFLKPSDTEHLAEGLRLAGVEEGDAAAA
ncbi:MAG: hypothetical protein NVS2B11_05380 [Acetobacteraceae bacterium]